MARVVVVGGGPAGCAAAMVAAKTGAEVVLLERMGTLGGLSSWCGQLMGWGARQEAKLMGGGEIYKLWESLEIHRKSDWGVPDGNVLWDVTKIEEATLKLEEAFGVQVMLRARVTDVAVAGNVVKAVVLADGRQIRGDVFVDATGNSGGVEVCEAYGQGCALCLLKCTIFGDRVSITAKAGVADRPGKARYLNRHLVALNSLSPSLRAKVEETPGGYSFHPAPEDFFKIDFTPLWPHPDRPVRDKWKEREISICDVRFAKVLLHIPMEYVRRISGFENAWLANPLTAEGMTASTPQPAPHDNALQVTGLENVFAGGLRAGVYSSAVPAMFVAELAAHNAVRKALGMKLLVLPKTTIQGVFISEVNEGRTPVEWGSDERPPHPKFKEYGLDIPRVTDYQRIRQSIVDAGLLGIYERKLA